MSFELKDFLAVLFDYFKMYQESSTPLVERWSQNDLNKVLKWAESCQDMSKKMDSNKKVSFYKKNSQYLKKLAAHYKMDHDNLEDLIRNAKSHIIHVRIIV